MRMALQAKLGLEAPSIYIGGGELPAAGDGAAQVCFGARGIIGHACALTIKIAAPDKLARIGILAHGANGQIGICPHKKVYNARVGTTLRGDHARPPWSFVSLPFPRYRLQSPSARGTLSKPNFINSPSFRRCNIAPAQRSLASRRVLSRPAAWAPPARPIMNPLQTRSSTTAMPWPTPMHMDTTA